MGFVTNRFLRTTGTYAVEDLDAAVSFPNVTAPGTDSGKLILPIFLDLAKITNAADVLTGYIPGFPGKILSLNFHVHAPVTTPAKALSLNAEIGAVNLTGGVVSLTSANCATAGAQVAGTPVTGGNVFTNAGTISIEATSVTAFIEGSGWLLIGMQNTDTLAIGTQLTTLLTRLTTVGLMA